MASLGIITLDDDLAIENRHSWLIRPDGWVFDDKSEAAQKNGLTHAQLMADGVDAMEPLRLYSDLIAERRIVVGFNVLHDLKTLRAEMRYKGLPDLYMNTRYVCVMQGCRSLVDARTDTGKKKAPRLEEACVYFQIDQGAGAHTGMGDAESAYQILVKLRDAGCMPAFKDPYEKTSEPKKAHRAHLDRQARPTGRDYEEQVIREQQDFIGGASEDGK